jgi:hypothetical protein
MWSMKKVAALVVLIAASSFPAMAQKFSFLKYDRSKVQLGGGYNYVSLLKANGTNRLNTSGFDIFAEYRVIKWISLTADIAGTYNHSGNTSTTLGNGTTQLYTGLIGPRFYPLGHQHKITPFGHFLFGAGVYGLNIPSQGGYNAYSNWDRSYTWLAGAGLDYRLKKRWSIRIIEADYEHTDFYKNSTPQGNYRASVGLVYHFGQK